MFSTYASPFKIKFMMETVIIYQHVLDPFQYPNIREIIYFGVVLPAHFVAGPDVDGPHSAPKLPMPKKPRACATKKTDGEAGLGRQKNMKFVKIEKTYVWFMSPWQDSTTVVAEEKFEAFRNFGGSRYAVTISRCQQLALSKASGAVPLPSEQLALANQKREKEPRSYHVLMKT